MPGPILCASPCSEDPLSRGYGVSLPNSLTVNLPSASVYSTRLRVSVCGTGGIALQLADFLGSMFTLTIDLPEGVTYCQVRLGRWICLPPSAPTPFNRLFRQPAEVSLPRPRVARMASAGILTGSSICLAFRLIIRLRLTPGRLTSPGNPWSYGGGESHPPYRYLCLHLLFQTLHGGSRLPLRR